MLFKKYKNLKIATTIVLLLFSLFINCNDEKLENEAINYLNKNYERSVYKHKFKNEIQVSVDFSRKKKIVERDLAYLKNIGNITVLHMCECSITDKGIEYINPLKDLRVLSLENTNLTDNGLQMICMNHPNLERLILNNTPITSEGLKHIGKLKKLNFLELRGSKIDDEATVYLSELENIVNLTIANTKVTDKSVPYLMKFPKIGTLIIVRTQITKEGSQVLKDHYEKSKSGTVVYWDPKTAP